jgi:hypothetical protein
MRWLEHITITKYHGGAYEFNKIIIFYNKLDLCNIKMTFEVGAMNLLKNALFTLSSSHVYL